MRTVIPALVRPGGLLMAIHPEDVSAAHYAEQVVSAGLEVISSERVDDIVHCPTLDDFAEYISRQPGMPDVRVPEQRSLLMAKAQEYGTPAGDFAIPRPYVIWAARRPLDDGPAPGR